MTLEHMTTKYYHQIKLDSNPNPNPMGNLILCIEALEKLHPENTFMSEENPGWIQENDPELRFRGSEVQVGVGDE